MTEVRVYPRHLRPAGLCAMGLRRAGPALEAQYGLDLARFWREGIAVSELLDIQDANVQKMVAVALAEGQDGQE